MVTVDDIDQGVFGQVQLTLVVQASIKKHQQAFQLKATSTKHYKVRQFVLLVDRSPRKKSSRQTKLLTFDRIARQ